MANDYTPVFDENTAQRLAVAEAEGNDFADSEIGNDFRLAPDFMLRQKYGDAAVRQRRDYFRATTEQGVIRANNASAPRQVADTALGVASGFVGTVGAVTTLGVAGAGLAQDALGLGTGLSEFSTELARSTEEITGFIAGGQSDELKARQRLSGIEAELDAEDNLAEYNRRTNDGADGNFIDDLAWFGRGALNNAGRVAGDGAVAADFIAQGIGSLGPSAKIAGAASRLVTRSTSFNAAKAAHAINPTAATAMLSRGADAVQKASVAIGVGAVEGAGVYAQTVNSVLGMTHGELLERSPEYKAMVENTENPVDPDSAKAQIAANTGMDAFQTTFPAAVALGLMAGRFEAGPIQNFRGAGFIDGLRTIGVQALEEAGQGAAGQFSENYAIVENVNDGRGLMDGVAQSLAEGAIAGTGMAGISAVPAVAADTPRAAGVIARAAASTGASGVRAAGRGANAALQSTAGQAVGRVAREGAVKAQEVAAPVVANVRENIQERNERTDIGIQSEKLQKLDGVRQLIDAEKNAGSLTQEDSDAIDKIDVIASADPVTKGFEDTIPANGTVLQNASGILQKFSQKGFKIGLLSDSDVLYAMQQVQNLKNVTNDLPKGIREQVTSVLSSPDFKRVTQKAQAINLRETQTEATEVTPTTAQDTVTVASTNPMSVNAEFVGRVLEQRKDLNLTPEKVAILQAAQKAVLAMNERVGNEIKIESKKDIAIEKRDGKKPTPKDISPTSNVSRNLVLGGFGSGKNKGEVRSLSEFMSDAMAAGQSPDGKFVTVRNVISDAGKVQQNFLNFAQHMVNKNEAMNESIRNLDERGNGTSEKFTYLRKDGKMIDKDDPTNSVGKMTYRANSPAGVALAEAIFEDTMAVVKSYNAAAEAFPRDYPDGQVELPQPQGQPARIVEPTTKTPTVVDEGLSADKPEEATNEKQNRKSQNKATEGSQSDEGQTGEKEPSQQGSDANPEGNENEDPSGGLNTDPFNQTVLNFGDQLVLKDIEDPEIAAAVRKLVDDTLLSIGVEMDIEIFEQVRDDNKKRGHAHWNDGKISLSKGILNDLGNRNSQHIVVHEVMHMVDHLAVDGPETMSMKNFDFDAVEGPIYGEAYKATQRRVDGRIWAKYFEYAFSFGVDQPKIVASELFAEIASVYVLNPREAEALFPKGVEYVKAVIQSAQERSGAQDSTVSSEEGGTTETPTTDTTESTTVPAVIPAVDRTFDNVHPMFQESFLESDVDFQNADEILQVIESNPENSEFMKFVGTMLPLLMEQANGRLKVIDGIKDKAFARMVLGEDVTNIRAFKNTIFVDQTTGEYDPDLLSIASLVVLDWVSGVRSSNPASLKDTMDDMGLEFSMLTSEDVLSLKYGVPPRQVSEDLSKRITRMWSRRINKDVPMVDARGAVEGLVKELLQSLTFLKNNEGIPYDLITVDTVPIVVNGVMKKQEQFNVFNMQAYQKDIGIVGQEAMSKALMSDLVQGPSIGETIGEVDQTQARGDVPLSALEKRASIAIQNTPHRLSRGLSKTVSDIEYDELKVYLGYEDPSDLSEDHPLRMSIEGKNLSIERDYNDAFQVANSILSMIEKQPDTDPAAYYRVGISKVGRHQMKGINPQNNKILRALVTPTHSVLDMTTQKHIDAFWLTVAQATDFSSDFKVEGNFHEDILSEIQEVFNDELGGAVDIITHYIQTGNMSSKDLMFAMGGTGDMQKLSAVFAVAEYQLAVEAGTQSSFATTLSFELDGKTDGPGNMMVNFGQGLLTEMEFENFKRIGFFLGTKNMTLNKFFGDKTQSDLYELSSKFGQSALFEKLNEAGKNTKKDWAVARFAAQFGDLEFSQDVGDEFILTRSTSKNPMTKTVFGASASAVGGGLASDIVIEMYRQLIANGAGNFDAYPEFQADFALLFGAEFPQNADWNATFVDKESMKLMKFTVTDTLGQILSASAKTVIGNKIQSVTDNLVLMTNFQNEYMKLKFDELLDKVIQDGVKQGRISVINGKPNRQQITQRDYDSVIDQLKEFSPSYNNGMQTLNIGAFARTDSGIRLSETMDGKFQMSSSMLSPDDVGVKVIPYITQGRGDAMMMNNVYGAENAPEGTVPVFDGIDMGIANISDYAEGINEAVMKNWDADVLGDVLRDIAGFMDKTSSDTDLLGMAWKRALSNAKAKGTSFTGAGANTLIAEIDEMRNLNLARKRVFKKIGVSVDHMAGSNIAYTRGPDGADLTLEDINMMIQEEISNIKRKTSDSLQLTSDDVIEGTAVDLDLPAITSEAPKVNITNANTMMRALLQETRSKPVAETIRALMKGDFKNSRIVTGSRADVVEWYETNIGILDADDLTSGVYDPQHNVLLMLDNNHETLTHELIHMATFQKILDVYESGETNDTVVRLENLMTEFMDSDFSNSSKAVQDAVNDAKAQILTYQSQTDMFSKAGALNEFMAWTLSNDALIRELKESPTSQIQRLTKAVKVLMQRLLGVVPKDMYSNILFNAELLITGNDGNLLPPVDAGDGGDNGGDGIGGDEITPGAQKRTNFWIELVRARVAALEERGTNLVFERRKQMKTYADNAFEALATLDFAGFGFTAYQKKTFTAMHTVLAMEMRLATAPSIAVNQLFEFITDNLSPEMFGDANAEDRYTAVMNLFGNTANDEGVSDSIAVLLALSQTSKGFRRALDQLPTPPSQEGVQTQSLNDFLGSLTASLMGRAVGEIDTSDPDIKAQLDNLSESILFQDSETEYRMLANLMKSVTKADAFTQGAFKKLAGYTDNIYTEAQKNDRSRLMKILTGSAAIATAFMDPDRAGIQAEGIKKFTHMGHSLDGLVLFREFVTEIVGTDENSQNVVALLDRTNFSVSSIRQAFRERLPVILRNEFKKPPTEDQLRAAQKVMASTDFSSLFNLKTPNAGFRLISDEGHLDKKIAEMEKAINANYTSAVAQNIFTKGQQLADFMNGKGAGFQLFTNAFAINRMAGDYKPGMTEEIDKLISMYAVKGSNPKDRIQISEMYANDPEGMKNLVVYMQALNKEEDAKIISIEAEMNGYKGYVPDHGTQNTRIVIEDDSRQHELEKKGFMRVGPALADEKFTVSSKGYYVASTKQTGTYSQGVMQTVQDTYRGVDANTGLSVNGTTGGVISGDLVEIITDQLNVDQGVADTREVLRPIFDANGIVQYERLINPEVMRKYQNPKSNLALMLGAWAGRQVEEKMAQQYNQELVLQLKKTYDERNPSDDDLYVNIEQEAQDSFEYNQLSLQQKKRVRRPDAVYADSWRVISPQTKEMIKEVFGEGQFWVRKDQVNIALGYRDPSVVDMWTGDTRVPEAIQQGVQAVTASIVGNKAMKSLALLEGGVQGVISGAKDLIVVRSIIVPYMNTQANVFQLATRGVGFKQMKDSFPDKLAEIEKYNENVERIILLDSQMLLAADNKNRVAVLQQQKQVILDQNARFSIAPLIEAGAYKNISEGITDFDVDPSTLRIGDWMENQTNKLTERFGIQTIAKYGLLSKDTAIYKGANRAVQYGDFIAKAIYFDTLTKQQGLTAEQAMVKVNEEFVNFSVLPGRTRSYLEGIGATWFLSFKIRIAKIAMQQLRENPARSLVLSLTVADLGSPQADNLASVIMDGRIGNSLGWEMLWSSPGLNPWLNVSDWD